jgi:hypothetical protein
MTDVKISARAVQTQSEYQSAYWYSARPIQEDYLSSARQRVSELEYDKFTRSAVFMTEWLTWALGVFRRFDPLQPLKPRRKRSHLPAERRSLTGLHDDIGGKSDDPSEDREFELFPWRRETRHLIRLKHQAGIITDEMAELRYAYHDAAHDHDLARMGRVGGQNDCRERQLI